jgi:NAD(P)-dependent dehydrogenase (short-subunit alcohol dehydrogenase family)
VRRVVALVFVFVWVIVGPVFAESTSAEQRPTVLITGASRGIGLALAHVFAEKGWEVIATCRDPATAKGLKMLQSSFDSVRVLRLDVTDERSIERLAGDLRGVRVDVLINNAGILGAADVQRWNSLSYDQFAAVFKTNVYGPLAVSFRLTPNVAISRQKKIVAITSGMSSITRAPDFQDMYFYRSSKAALNMAMRAMQRDVRALGINVLILAPGAVETSLLRSGGYSGPAMSPRASAMLLYDKIAETPTDFDPQLVLSEGAIASW